MICGSNMATPTTAAMSKTSASEVDSESPLFEACKNGDLDKVKLLLTSEIVNSRDLAGRKSTPLHFAAGG